MSKKKIYNLVIVDESGSMYVIQKQALAGINETLDTIVKMQKKYEDMEQVVTLLTFDSDHLTFIYDNATAKDIKPLRSNQYNPGGATPLYDAIGKGIAKVNALTGSDDNVLVTIITDGQENCSREYNLSMVKNLIEKLKKSNWTFTLIGTDNLDVEGMAYQMSIDNNLSFCQDEEGTQKMFKRERISRMAFNSRRHNDEEEVSGSFFNL